MKEANPIQSRIRAVTEPPGMRPQPKPKPKGTGRRESKKADKLRRIRTAALSLFSSQGYEATTMRQIARRARVALGTLSLYADDKSDLVVLIFNEMVSGILANAEQAAQREAALLDKLVAFFAEFYKDIAANIPLARTHHQLNFQSSGRHGAEYSAHRDRALALIERMIRDAQAERQIMSREDPALIARHIFFCYTAAARWWVAVKKPDLDRGLQDLRELFRLQITGLQPAPSAVVGDRAGK
jgi:AcrR family transcriptional regulator